MTRASRRTLLGTAALLSAAEVAAQPAPRTFVLVHGAWHGGWCWRRVADRLHAAGHTVFAPSLTGLADRAHLLGAAPIGLGTHVADVAGLFRWESLSDVVLVGHSYGGMVISGVAGRLPQGALRALVFLDAFVPRDGESVADLASPGVRDAIARLAADGSPAMPPVPAAAFNVNPRDRAWVDAMCTPQPLATLTDRVALTGARERAARRTYIRATGYPSPGFDAMRARVAAEPGWEVAEIASGHDAMVDMPDRLTELLLAAG